MKNNNYSSSFSLKLYNLCQRFPFIRKLKSFLYFTDGILLLFIKKPKNNLSKRKNVLIIYNFAFGDGINFLCAFKNIRKIYDKKSYYVSIICQKGLDSIYTNSKLFDEVIPYDLTKSTFDIKTRFGLFKLLRKKYYDIIIDPIGPFECTTNIFMTRALQADKKITIIDNTLGRPMSPRWMIKKIYTNIYEINEPNLSLVEYYNKLLNSLSNKKFDITLSSIDTKNVKIELPDKYFIVFPSASTLLKRWPIDRYTKIVNLIYEKTKLPVLFCGTNSDNGSIDELKSKIMNIPQYDYVNKTNLIEFIEIIKKAKFVITNDTSTYHIAVINQIPVTIITGGYTFDRYVKYDFNGSEKYRKPYYAVSKNSKCFNCDNKCCRLKSNDQIWPCLNDISINDAWRVIEKMIDNEVIL